jgi:hypothetical protein
MENELLWYYECELPHFEGEECVIKLCAIIIWENQESSFLEDLHCAMWLVRSYRHFNWTYCLHLQNWAALHFGVLQPEDVIIYCTLYANCCTYNMHPRSFFVTEMCDAWSGLRHKTRHVWVGFLFLRTCLCPWSRVLLEKLLFC